jgi:hypothetical protein
MSSENIEKLKTPTTRAVTTPARASAATNSNSSASEPARCGAIIRPRNWISHVVMLSRTTAMTAHAASVPRMSECEPLVRLALSPSAFRGLTFSNKTSGIASAQRAMVRASTSTSPMKTTVMMPAAAQNCGGCRAM